MKTITKTIIGAGIILASYLPAKSQDSVKVNAGFNAVETALTSNKNIRTRIINSPSIDYKGINLQYHGLNEINNVDLKNFLEKTDYLLVKLVGKIN